MMPKKQEAEKENGERWLVTYSDLITLLLIFFVVLYSMSQISAKKFDELSQSMAIVFNGQAGRSGVLDGGRTVFPDPQVHKPKRNITNTREQIRRMIANLGLEGKISVRDESRGLVISVKDTVFFRAGSADLGGRASEIITKVSAILANLPNSIRIEGHTDNIPIHTTKFYSNWELSTARATNVLHYMIQNASIPPERLSAAGYGEFKPITTNDNEAGRAANRRVDIVILGDDYEKFEPGTEQASSGNQVTPPDISPVNNDNLFTTTENNSHYVAKPDTVMDGEL